MSLSVIILAAGKGSRMRSDKPKVLHQVGAKPMLGHVIDVAKDLHAEQIIVIYGHGGDQVKQTINDEAITWIEQKEQLGTGHAVKQALPIIPDDHEVLILYGDVPLLTTGTLAELLETADVGALAVLTADMPDPTGLGRVVRNARGKFVAIVEHKDASPEQHKITEINTGIMAVDGIWLKKWLNRVNNNNAQGEYYLTDIVALATEDGMPVAGVMTRDVDETMGVNDRSQLAEAERVYQARLVKQLMVAGATVKDPSRLDIRGNVTVGRDVIIDVNVVLEGEVTLADGVHIGPNCVITDTSIGAGTVVKANSVLESATIAENADIGPFARLRPGTNLAAKAKVGNFVEIKNATVGEGSKVNHLTYVGDAEIGTNSNIGAGTITCNYDGAAKHKTTIGDNVFVGSGVQLVAPVALENGATIAAGSTVTKTAPADQLTVARAKQVSTSRWRRPTKPAVQEDTKKSPAKKKAAPKKTATKKTAATKTVAKKPAAKKAATKKTTTKKK